MKPIRVLHIHGGAIHGGASEHIMTLARGMREFPVEIMLAVLKDGTVSDKAREIDLPVFPVKRKFRGDLSVVFRMASLIREMRIDIVHTHTVNSNFYGRLASLLAREPIIVTTVHTDLPKVIGDDYPFGPTRKMVLGLNGFMNRYASRLITVSETMRQTMLDWGIREERISVVYNGLDANVVRKENFSAEDGRRAVGLPDRDEMVIGTAGRLVPCKNFDMLIRAARLIIERGHAAKFVIMGDGPQRERLEKLARSQGVGEAVIFTGWRGDFTRVLSSFDICAITSKTETTSLVALQAMALSKPVVATRAGSLPEIITDGKTGVLVPLDDEIALADAIDTLIEDTQARENLGREARKRIESTFDAAVMAEKTWELYREILSEEGKSNGSARVI